MRLNLCVTRNVMFMVCSWTGKAYTRVKAWPVRSKLLRGLMRMFIPIK